MAVFASKLAVLVSLVASANANEGKCSDEVATLKKQLAEAKASLASCGSSKPISLVDACTGAYGLGADAVGQLLDKTTVDEQLAGIVSDGFGKAKQVGAGVADKVMSVDYDGYVKQLKSHELYKTHVEKNLKPVMDQYVNPAWEKANVHVGPALESAKVAGNKAFGTVSEHAPKHMDGALSTVDRTLTKIFETLGSVAPGHAQSLPTHRVDRVLFLLLGGFVAFHLLALALWILRMNFRIAGFCLRIAKWLFYVVVTLPLKIIGFLLWICTGFYCCGLCRRKSKASAPKTATKGDKVGKVATVDELKKLLENAKKEKKLEAAVKQLLNLANGGKPMTGPKSMEGKTVTKDVLTQTVGKFKELNAKKLGL